MYRLLKNLKLPSHDSDNSSLQLDAGEANIGLDLLANNNKE